MIGHKFVRFWTLILGPSTSLIFVERTSFIIWLIWPKNYTTSFKLKKSFYPIAPSSSALNPNSFLFDVAQTMVVPSILTTTPPSLPNMSHDLVVTCELHCWFRRYRNNSFVNPARFGFHCLYQWLRCYVCVGCFVAQPQQFSCWCAVSFIVS